MISWGKLGWNKAAGMLTVFGLTGLLLSPLILTPAVSAPAPEGRIVAIAISAGPQLQLLRIDHAGKPQQRPSTAKQAMVCGRVFRLSFADIGFSCQGETSASAVTAMKSSIPAKADTPQNPLFAVAGN